MKLLHYSWIPILLILLCLPRIASRNWREVLSSWEGWLVILALASVCTAGLHRSYLFWYNHKGK